MYGSSLERENADLRAELERQRWEEQDRREREEREWREEQRRRKEEREEQLRTVSDWPDAFSKGLFLYRREASGEASDNAIYANDPGYTATTFFQDQVKQIERAQAIYQEEAARVEEEIAKLRSGMLEAVGARLEQEYPDCYTADYLRNDNPSALVDW